MEDGGNVEPERKQAQPQMALRLTKGENRIVSNKYRVIVDGTAYTVEVEPLGAGTPMPAPVAAPAPVADDAMTVTAPMPGKILSVKVNVGDSVNSGDLVLMLEAMKMENEVFATASGKVTEIRVKSGDNVSTGDILMVIA